MTGETSRDLTAILEERARALARPPDSVDRVEGTQMVVFAVGGERYAVDIRHVGEVHPASESTQLPGAPEFWVGLVNVRGGLYPVLDLARYMGLSPASGEGILLLVSGAGLDIAVLVDGVIEAREILADEVRRPAGGGPDPKTRAIRGTTAELVSVLDLDVLLSDPQLTVDRQPV